MVLQLLQRYLRSSWQKKMYNFLRYNCDIDRIEIINVLLTRYQNVTKRVSTGFKVVRYS